MKKPETKSSRLAAQIAKNRRGAPVQDEKAAELLDEYLGGKTSYRKLAAKHKLSVGAVMRAIHRAGES